jgi:hypothetical protein
MAPVEPNRLGACQLANKLYFVSELHKEASDHVDIIAWTTQIDADSLAINMIPVKSSAQ